MKKLLMTFLFSFAVSSVLYPMKPTLSTMQKSIQNKSALLKARVQHFHAVPSINMYKPLFQDERKKFYQQLKGQPWAPVTRKYITQFKQERYDFMKELIECSPGFTPQKWQELKIEFAKKSGELIEKYEVAKGDVTKIHPQLLSKIQHSITACGIDTSKIIIDYSDKPGVMAATRSKLIVHEQACTDFKKIDSNDWIQAAIFHELQHIMHDDAYTTACLKIFYHYSQNRLCKLKWLAFNNKYNHFQEKRADTFAGLMGLDYVRALLFRFRRYDLMAIPSCNTHPPFSVRIAYLQKIHDEMLQTLK